MDQRKLFEVINFFKKQLERRIHVSKLILFGSQSSGHSTNESDIDLIIVSEDFQGKNIFERAELTKEAEVNTIKKFSVPLDVLDMTPQQLEDQRSLKSMYARTGISV